MGQTNTRSAPNTQPDQEDGWEKLTVLTCFLRHLYFYVPQLIIGKSYICGIGKTRKVGHQYRRLNIIIETLNLFLRHFSCISDLFYPAQATSEYFSLQAAAQDR
jgi:hypothetical protein